MMNHSPAADSLSRTIVTICTYNELENLPRLFDEIHQVIPQTDILVVDDNSPDGTGKLADERAASDARIHVLHRTTERGLGTATLAAFGWVCERPYDVLINLDADFSHHPRYLPALLEALEDTKADVAIGSRYVEGGEIRGWPAKRHWMSRGINMWSRFWLGLSTRDCSGSYRAYRCDILRKLDLKQFRSTGYAVQEEMLFRCQQAGAHFTEVPILFQDRIEGESKINQKEAFKALITLARCGMERKK